MYETDTRPCQYCGGTGVAPDNDYCQYCGGDGFVVDDRPRGWNGPSPASLPLDQGE